MLHFTASSSSAQLSIAPLLPESLAEHPSVTLDLRLTETRFDLIDGSFDLALRNSPLEHSVIMGRKLADDCRILCKAPAYLERMGYPSHPRDLTEHSLIAFQVQNAQPINGPAGPVGMLNLRQSGCQLTVDDGMAVKSATVAGASTSLNLLLSVHRELANGQLVQVLPEFQVDDPSVLWHDHPIENVLSAKVRVIIDFLLESGARATAWEELSPQRQ